MFDSIYFNEIRIRKIEQTKILEILPYVLNSEKGIHVHLLAASSIVAASRVQGLTEIFNSGFSVCDSSPLSRIIRLRNSGFTNLRGSDFLRQSIENDGGTKRHFFIVSNEKVFDSLKRYAAQSNSRFTICGNVVPPYSDDFDFAYESWIAEIKASDADCVWIGLGSPKQDVIAYDLSKKTGLLCIAAGAAFEFVSGERKEAPKLVQKLSLEWLFRLFLEPRRLIKRYTIDNFFFILSACKYLLRKEF